MKPYRVQQRAVAGLVIGVVAGSAWAGDGPLATTPEDYFQPGTQGPGGVGAITQPMASSDLNCVLCHGNFFTGQQSEPYSFWISSMMGQSARDPLFHACLEIAKQDAVGSSDFCMRCHAPNAFLERDPVPTGPDEFTGTDIEGVNCSFCHRLVDPDFKKGISPAVDEGILDALGDLVPQGSNARYVVSPMDSRRGPFDLPANPHGAASWLNSPFHREAELCWTCHDVSNPLLTRQPDGTYVMNELDAPHPTQLQEDMFPLHRTYSEWKNSYYFTLGGWPHNGRFGGDIPEPGIVASCQDCHMPDAAGPGCNIGFPDRPDTPQHSFAGSNYWVRSAILALDTEGTSGLTEESVAAAEARSVAMLQAATDMTVAQEEDGLAVRVVNQSGHKVPTGFPDGRRMWLNVKFFDPDEMLIDERGAYDEVTADLTTGDTKVYEIELGVDAVQAAATGLPEGKTFHFMLANTILKDNRIPPRGFLNSVAEENHHAPVGATYLNGQNWDDTLFDIPEGAKTAVVTLYYQLTSKSFMEFLRDGSDPGPGRVAYDQWVAQGKSAPVVMDMVELLLSNPADVDGDGTVGVGDLLQILGEWGPCDPAPFAPCSDIDGDGQVGVNDLLAVLGAWGFC